MDYFTKWAEAYPIREFKAATVAKVLLENCFTRLGISYEIVSDEGFDETLLAELTGKISVIMVDVDSTWRQTHA